MPEQNPTLGPRTRFFDELVLAADRVGIRQVVLLGAGMDTRAFRLPLHEETIVFELDRRSLLEEKQEILDAQRAKPRCLRVSLAADLERESWAQALRAAGLQTSSRSVFLLEALSWCLSESTLARVLDELCELGASGSGLGIDILSRDYLGSPALLPILRIAATHGVLWQFGTNDPAGFLAAHGWCAEVFESSEVCARFGRWPPPGLGASVAAGAAIRRDDFLLRAKLSG